MFGDCSSMSTTLINTPESVISSACIADSILSDYSDSSSCSLTDVQLAKCNCLGGGWPKFSEQEPD